MPEETVHFTVCHSYKVTLLSFDYISYFTANLIQQSNRFCMKGNKAREISFSVMKNHYHTNGSFISAISVKVQSHWEVMSQALMIFVQEAALYLLSLHVCFVIFKCW